MLTKKVLKKKTSAIFLAIILVLGTIALTLPSFSVEAQATKDRENDYDHDEDKKSYDKDDYKSEYSSYGKYKDRDHDKYKKDSSSSVSIKKVKCNNINVNLNGIDVNIGGLPDNGPVTGPMALAQEEADDNELESNSIQNDNDKSSDGRDGQSDSGKDSRIVCINNNNNIVVGEELTCEDCFTKVLSDEELDDLIQAIIEDGGPHSIQELCELLTENIDDADSRAFLSDRLFVLGNDVGISKHTINRILDCLEKVFGEEFPRVILPDLEPLSVQQQQHMNWKS
jgi:hypothetical protein